MSPRKISLTRFIPTSSWGGTALYGKTPPVWGQKACVSWPGGFVELACSSTWCAARLADDGPYAPVPRPPPATSYRSGRNFRGEDIIVLDVDVGHHLVTIGMALRAGGFAFVLLPTRNHLKSKDGVVAERFRVAVPTEKRLTRPEDHLATITALDELCGGVSDRKAWDVSHSFWPSIGVADEVAAGKRFPVVKGTAAPSATLEAVSPGPAIATIRDPAVYAARALSREVTQLANAPNGERNDAANRCAFNVARVHIRCGGLPPAEDAFAELHEAGLAAGLDAKALTRTLQSGWIAGVKAERAARGGR